MRKFERINIEDFKEDDSHIVNRNIIMTGKSSWEIQFPNLDYSLIQDDETLGFFQIYENGCLVIFLFRDTAEKSHAVLFFK